MIGHWLPFEPGQMPQENEPLVFMRIATPPIHLLDGLGEKAELVPAVFRNGVLLQQNGHEERALDGIWWTSLPPPPPRSA